MNPDQTAPISCNIGLLRTEADERAREHSHGGLVVECLT